MSNHIQRALGLPESAYLHRPAANEPGRMLDQLLVAATSIYLAERRGSCARAERPDARRVVLDHARHDGEDE